MLHKDEAADGVVVSVVPDGLVPVTGDPLLIGTSLLWPPGLLLLLLGAVLGFIGVVVMSLLLPEGVVSLDGTVVIGSGVDVVSLPEEVVLSFMVVVVSTVVASFAAVVELSPLGVVESAAAVVEADWTMVVAIAQRHTTMTM